MEGEHIVSSYDEELRELNDMIARMGGLTESQIARAIEALVNRNPDLAEMVVADDESWGITEAGHLQAYGQAMSSHLGPIDFAAAARAFGALGTRVEDRDELPKALAAGLAAEVPSLVHVPVAAGIPGG